MYFERPFEEWDIEALIQTRQPFEWLNCRGNRYQCYTKIEVINGRKYVVKETVYQNGMHPGESAPLDEEIKWLNNAPGLRFLPIYTK